MGNTLGHKEAIQVDKIIKGLNDIEETKLLATLAIWNDSYTLSKLNKVLKELDDIQSIKANQVNNVRIPKQNSKKQVWCLRCDQQGHAVQECNTPSDNVYGGTKRTP